MFSRNHGMPPLELSPRAWWVAWLGDIPVAFAAIRITGKFAWLSTCGVLRRHRRRGLQKRLIAVRLRYAKRNGATTVYTYTVIGNNPSACALIRQGFRPATPPDDHAGTWAGDDVNYWRLISAH